MSELNELVGSLFKELIDSVRIPEPLEVAPGLTVTNPTKKQANELMKATTEEEAQRIIFGDQFDKAMELFDPQPVQVWNAFMEKYNEHFFGSKSQDQICLVAQLFERYWKALNWDFQHILNHNVLDYFAAPCRCGQCRERHGDFANRYVSRRTWDQFISHYECLLAWRGSYTQAMYLSDPEVIDMQANAPDEDWKSGGKPGLWQWTKEMDAAYYIADQVQAGRIRNPDDFRPYPRPELPAEKERKRRKERKVNSGIEAALARGAAAAKANWVQL
ncbi:tail assembly chaperone [Mycobacterium phage Jubie]|nr:tail assembly chaperone [Mycobacterium phage Samty]QDK03549.1 tail assembly chaperone [Mycobacterium phage Finnry]QPL14900.1 tail assembly chaperone [Mycobacterium phage Jubie]